MLEVSFESSCIMVKIWLKVMKKHEFSTLRKFYKFRKFDFSKWNLDFSISWWISFIFWHVSMNFDPWHLFDQKVKVWLFSVQLIFDQLIGKFICQSNAFGIFWTCWIGQDDVIESMFEPNLPLARSKVRYCPCTVKTLKMTILPFWWSG